MEKTYSDNPLEQTPSSSQAELCTLTTNPEYLIDTQFFDDFQKLMGYTNFRKIPPAHLFDMARLLIFSNFSPRHVNLRRRVY